MIQLPDIVATHTSGYAYTLLQDSFGEIVDSYAGLNGKLTRLYIRLTLLVLFT